jgi:hypothetical protein
MPLWLTRLVIAKARAERRMAVAGSRFGPHAPVDQEGAPRVGMQPAHDGDQLGPELVGERQVDEYDGHLVATVVGLAQQGPGVRTAQLATNPEVNTEARAGSARRQRRDNGLHGG